MVSYEKNEVIEKNNELPWIEKYRPKQIDQIISHKEIIQSLKNFIEMKMLPHLLFFGPSGTGKTSTIISCANEIYGIYVNCMVLQLNASNERGIETVRTKVKNFVSNKNRFFLPLKERDIFKLVILDEIDSMTVEAQGMLRQTIEKNSVTTRFCLICNDIDKINIALQSRCTLYRFSPLKYDDMMIRLVDICKLEKIKYNDNAIDAIIKISKGDMRSAINILQHVVLSAGNKITDKKIYKVSGHCMPSIIQDIFVNLINLTKKRINLNQCITNINNIVVENNITIFNLLEELKHMILNSDLKMEQKIFLIDNLSQNEIYDSVNVDPFNIIMIISSLFVWQKIDK